MCLVVSSIEQRSLLLDWCPHITFFNHHWIVFKDFLWKGAHSPFVVIPSLALLAQSECLFPKIAQVSFIYELSLSVSRNDAFPARLIHPWTWILLDRNTQSYYISSSIWSKPPPLHVAIVPLLSPSLSMEPSFPTHTGQMFGITIQNFFTRVKTKCWYFQYWLSRFFSSAERWRVLLRGAKVLSRRQWVRPFL